MKAILSDAQVTAIRTSGFTDSWWSKRLRVEIRTIRNARWGHSYRHVPTPPDLTPREASGCTHAIRQALPQKAIPARRRGGWNSL